MTQLSHAANNRTRNVPSNITDAATAATAATTARGIRRPSPPPDHYADSPQAWFCSIDATFAASWFTRSPTKFHWALSKLPFTLIDSISPLCRNPSAYTDPYQELQDILLRSYCVSAS